MDSLQTIEGFVQSPEAFTSFVNIVIGALMHGLIEWGKKKPDFPNMLLVPVVLIVGLGLSWGASFAFAPGLPIAIIWTTTLAGFGAVDAGRSMLTK